MARSASVLMLGGLLGLLNAVSGGARTVTLSNLALPVDQNGEQILTGEASVVEWRGQYYFYFNNWGACPGVDCCGSAAGCASCCFDDYAHYLPGCSNNTNGSNPYGLFHTVQVYRTNFSVWENLGVALPLSSRKPGIEFRPCVVYNENTRQFVMWYEDRGAEEIGYAIATSPTPQGPFKTTHINVTMPGAGRIGDFSIFVDDDGSAYHVRTGFDIVALDANFTGPAEHVASFDTPKSSEGPTLFKRNGTYFVTAGTGCCACLGGSSIYVLSAPSPAGPWRYQGDVGSVPGHVFDPHSPSNYVTKAQGTAVFTVGSQYIYLGNQWNSGLARTPPGPRNHDLLFWGILRFAPHDAGIEQMVWQDDVTIAAPQG